MAIVLLIQNNGSVTKLPMNKRMLVFGRSSKSDVQIDDKMMSGQHFSITVQQNRVLTVKDLESTNGTYLNGSKIDSSKIFIGDQVSVGGTTISIDQSALNKHELQYFTAQERTTVRYIKPPKSQETLSIKRDIYEEFNDDAPKKKTSEKKVPKPEPIADESPSAISINFNPDGEIKIKEKSIPKVPASMLKANAESEAESGPDSSPDNSITTSNVIEGSQISEEQFDKKEYQATGATKFIKLDKETLQSQKSKANRRKGGTGIHKKKKGKKKKKKKEKPKSLFAKIFSIFSK